MPPHRPARDARPLPRHVRPQAAETVLSYVHRLADAHHLTLRTLLAVIEPASRRRTYWSPADDITLDPERRAALAVLSGHPPTQLRRALPALSQTPPAGSRLHLHWKSQHSPLGARVCPDCQRRRAGAHPARWAVPPRIHCASHGLWLAGPRPQRAPARWLVAAQRTLDLTWQQHPQSLAHAFALAGALLSDWRGPDGTYGPLAPRWRAREAHLSAFGFRPEPQHQIPNAVTFPEHVELTAELAAEPARRAAHGEQTTLLSQRLAIRLGIHHHPAARHPRAFRWLADPWHGIATAPTGRPDAALYSAHGHFAAPAIDRQARSVTPDPYGPHP